MSRKKSRLKLLLTERALDDIRAIESYSIQKWGKLTAKKYLLEMEQAFLWLQDNPQLLRPDESLHPHLHFYRVNQHQLVCDRDEKGIYVLTVLHASRDIPSRLAELEPTLGLEIDLLRQQL